MPYFTQFYHVQIRDSIVKEFTNSDGEGNLKAYFLKKRVIILI